MSNDPYQYRRYYGKYRGKVVDNIDPLFLGRILAEVAAVPGSTLNWAMPCVPYAGFQVGFYAIPPIGANVWIEYEGGDPNYPIWAGCFWGEGEVPLESPPEVKVFRTEFVTMILSDIPEEGGFTLNCIEPAVNIPLTMTFNSEGILISCPESLINMTAEDITVTVPESVVTITAEAIEIAVPESSITITPETITQTVPPAECTMSAEGLVVEGPEINVTGNVSVEGAVEITGETNITPELTVEGDANVAGALTVEGEANVALAMTVEGETNVAGALTAEGEVNVAGALTVEGDEAVAGVIEGVIVPPI